MFTYCTSSNQGTQTFLLCQVLVCLCPHQHTNNNQYSNGTGWECMIHHWHNAAGTAGFRLKNACLISVQLNILQCTSLSLMSEQRNMINLEYGCVYFIIFTEHEQGQIQGEARGAVTPTRLPLEMKLSSPYWLLKFVYLTSQLRHSSVQDPLPKKNPGSTPWGRSRAFGLIKNFRFEFPDISSDEWNSMFRNLREQSFLPGISVLFVQWFAFRKFNIFRIFWKLSQDIPIPFVSSETISECSVEWKVPRLKVTPFRG